MPSYRAGEEMIEYYGEYLGHGRSKTAFELNCPGALFHGQVFKVAKAHDTEPSVFREAAQASLTTSVLYNCDGVDAASGKRFHCWITDRAIRWMTSAETTTPTRADAVWLPSVAS